MPFDKLLFGAALVASLAAVDVASAAPETPATTAARALLAGQRDAWNRGDLDAFMRDYWHDDDLRFAGGDSVRSGWQTTLDRYRKTYPDAAAMGHLDFELVEVREVTPALVYVFGRWRLDRADAAAERAPHGLFTLIVEEKDGRWVITRDHTSAAGG